MEKKISLSRRFVNKVYAIVDRVPFLRNPITRELTYALITAIIMSSLIVLVWFVSIPNPNMILIAGLVACSTLFGVISAILAASSMIVYSLVFFSTNHDFIHFSETNGQKLVVIVIGVLICTVFICFMRRTTLRERVLLKEDNEKLHYTSSTDALTGVKNRYAFKNDSHEFLDKNIILAILDIDNFKHINDTAGHYGGDEALVVFSQILGEMFGVESVYRFGGDEFLLLIDNDDTYAFEEQLKDLRQRLDANKIGENEVIVQFSCGYVVGNGVDYAQISDMLKTADSNLYFSKSNGKNCFKGSKVN